jgi:hypothetical protein
MSKRRVGTSETIAPGSYFAGQKAVRGPEPLTPLPSGSLVLVLRTVVSGQIGAAKVAIVGHSEGAAKCTQEPHPERNPQPSRAVAFCRTPRPAAYSP